MKYYRTLGNECTLKKKEVLNPCDSGLGTLYQCEAERTEIPFLNIADCAWKLLNRF